VKVEELIADELRKEILPNVSSSALEKYRRPRLPWGTKEGDGAIWF